MLPGCTAAAAPAWPLPPPDSRLPVQAGVAGTTFLKTRMGLGSIDAARPYLGARSLIPRIAFVAASYSVAAEDSLCFNLHRVVFFAAGSVHSRSAALVPALFAALT